MLAFLFLVIFVDKLLEQGMRWHNINQSTTGIIESDIAFFIDLLKYFKKFTFVRHPFTRIVSTYKDKIIDWTNYRDWRQFIGFDKKQPYKVCF